MIRLVKFSIIGSLGKGTFLLANASTSANCSAVGSNFSCKKGSGCASWDMKTSSSLEAPPVPFLRICLTAFNHSSTSDSVIFSLCNGKTWAVKLILDVFSAVLDELNLKLVAMVPAKPRGVVGCNWTCRSKLFIIIDMTYKWCLS